MKKEITFGYKLANPKLGFEGRLVADDLSLVIKYENKNKNAAVPRFNSLEQLYIGEPSIIIQSCECSLVCADCNNNCNSDTPKFCPLKNEFLKSNPDYSPINSEIGYCIKTNIIEPITKSNGLSVFAENNYFCIIKNEITISDLKRLVNFVQRYKSR